MDEIRWIVSGRVHGVGFRWATRRRAQEIGLVGWVRNVPDGTVEVAAGGTTEQLRALEQFLYQGPAFASVDRVEKSDILHEVNDFNDFKII